MPYIIKSRINFINKFTITTDAAVRLFYQLMKTAHFFLSLILSWIALLGPVYLIQKSG